MKLQFEPGAPAQLRDVADEPSDDVSNVHEVVTSWGKGRELTVVGIEETLSDGRWDVIARAKDPGGGADHDLQTAVQRGERLHHPARLRHRVGRVAKRIHRRRARLVDREPLWFWVEGVDARHVHQPTNTAVAASVDHVLDALDVHALHQPPHAAEHGDDGRGVVDRVGPLEGDTQRRRVLDVDGDLLHIEVFDPARMAMDARANRKAASGELAY